MSVRAHYNAVLLADDGSVAPPPTPGVLYASISSFSAAYISSTNIGTIAIGTFSDGPVTSTTILSGAAGGTIQFSASPTVASGTIFISGVTGGAGTYTGVFRISGPNGNVDIPFTLAVTTPVVFDVTPSSVSRTYYAGIHVGTGGLTYDVLATYANSGGSVSLTGGSTPAGTTLSIVATTGTSGEIRLSGTPVNVLTYTPTFTFTSPNGNDSLPSTLNVLAGGAITNPMSYNGDTIVDTANDGIFCSTTLTLYSDGQLIFTRNNAGAVSGTWFSPDVSGQQAGKYWVRFTVTGISGSTNGTTPSSTGWQSLSAARAVSINSTFTSNAPCTAFVTVQIAADAAGTQIVSTGNYGLQVYNTTPTPPPPVGAPVNPLPYNGGTIFRLVTSGGATVRLILNPNGTMQGDTQPPVSPVFSGNWYAPTLVGIGNSYWARFTYTGTVPNVSLGGWTANVWTPLSGTLMTGYNRSTIGVSIGTFTVQIASDAGGSNIVATGVYTLDCERESLDEGIPV